MINKTINMFETLNLLFQRSLFKNKQCMECKFNFIFNYFCNSVFQRISSYEYDWKSLDCITALLNDSQYQLICIAYFGFSSGMISVKWKVQHIQCIDVNKLSMSLVLPFPVDSSVPLVRLWTSLKCWFIKFNRQHDQAQMKKVKRWQLKIALCGLRWFKLNASKYQKDVKLSKRCQMSKNETPRLWRRFTKKLNWHNEVHRYWHQFWHQIWRSSKLPKNTFYEHFKCFQWPSFVTSKLTSISVNLIVSI